MNILPKTTKEFASKEYWDKFFKQRKESFEWYGDYQDLKSILSSYIKYNDCILTIGCGNSTLSVELYDDGFCKNTNIDISEIAINNMIKKYKDGRENLIFECMDMLQMSYPDGSFNVVLDKGTLDAVCSDDFDLNKMYSEISRVLKPFGRYICVSLLQEHVLRKFLPWFLESRDWICRIHRCSIKQNPNKVDVINFPVFIVSCIKLKNKVQDSLIELNMDGGKNFQKYRNIEEIHSVIKASQSLEFLKYFIRNNKVIDEDFSIELYDERTNIPESRYILYFVQKPKIVSKPNMKCSVFVVPQGREHEWLFSSAKGREQLLRQCRSDHMIVVLLSRKHTYGNMVAIQNELSSQIIDFFPLNWGKILFISIGDDIGSRSVLWEGNSDFNGLMFIEDVVIDKDRFRRLVFSNNLNVIQSEAKLKPKTSSINYLIDNRFLSCDHHQIIAAGLTLINKPFKESYHLLMIGLGGGCFISFLAQNLKTDVTLYITVIEIDPLILQVAEKYFDFKKNCGKNVFINVIIEDGLKYLSKVVNSKQKFDFIIFDVDSKDLKLGISCPPKQFVEEECLRKVETCLTDGGYFILNLVARDEDIKKEVKQQLKTLFFHCFYYKLEDDLNEIIFASNTSELQWLQIKDANLRFDHVINSCFYIDLLAQTYRQLCEKIRHF